MNIDGRIKLVSQLLDLPVIDRDEHWCGVVDDVALEGSAGKGMRIKALLVGPGAYERRLPAWAFFLVRTIAGAGMVSIPAGEIIEIGAVVKLKCAARELGLHRSEDRARRWVPRRGAL